KRTGKAPKFAVPFVCREELSKSEYTTKKYYPPGTVKEKSNAHQLEVLGAGNQFVAYAVHPETGQPYQWQTLDCAGQNNTLHATLPADLLELTRDDLAAIKAAFERIAENCGLVLEPMQNEGRRDGGGTVAPAGDSFFSKVNSKALHNLSAWFP